MAVRLSSRDKIIHIHGSAKSVYYDKPGSKPHNPLQPFIIAASPASAGGARPHPKPGIAWGHASGRGAHGRRRCGEAILVRRAGADTAIAVAELGQFLGAID